MFNTKKMVYSAFFLCLAMVLPFITGQIKILGKMLNLMHVAIFLCGMICGGLFGGVIGFIAPLLRSLLFGMPNLYPNAVAMAFELATYGAVSGFIYVLLHKIKGGIILSLIIAMLAGRAVWGIVSLILFAFMGESFTFMLFIKGAFVDSVVGIVLQLLIVPTIVYLLNRAKVISFNDDSNS